MKNKTCIHSPPALGAGAEEQSTPDNSRGDLAMMEADILTVVELGSKYQGLDSRRSFFFLGETFATPYFV